MDFLYKKCSNLIHFVYFKLVRHHKIAHIYRMKWNIHKNRTHKKKHTVNTQHDKNISRKCGIERNTELDELEKWRIFCSFSCFFFAFG